MVSLGSRVAFATALLLAATAAQTLPELPSGCYYTSTVVTIGAGSFSFSSMAMPSSPTTATSTVSVTPPEAVDPSNSPSTNPEPSSVLQRTDSFSSPPTGPTQNIRPGDPFLMAVSVNTQKAKRANLYVAFDQAGTSFVVSSKADATVFVIDEAGNLLSGAQFVGTSTSNGTATLQQFITAPIRPFSWRVNGSGITFGFASFCVDAAQQFSVVFGERAQGCSPVSIAAEASTASTTSMNAFATSTIRASASPLTAAVDSSSLSNLLASAPSSISSTGSFTAKVVSPTTGSVAALSSSLFTQSTMTTTFSSASTSVRSSSTRPVTCYATIGHEVPRPRPLKRGLAYGNVSSIQFYTRPSEISWAYNYYSQPNDPSIGNNGPYPPPQTRNLVYYPLLFNDHPSLTSIWEENVKSAVLKYGTDAIFSFNEPDLCVPGSACMTVEQALTAYELYIQPFKNCGLRLAAPSVSNAPGGFVWLDQSLGNATRRGLSVDIINIHWYASPYSYQYFQDYMTEAYERFGRRPIWITEYGMDQEYQEPAVLQFMKDTADWVKDQPWIEKVCWFGNYLNNLLKADGSGLSPRGRLWNSYAAEEDPLWPAA